MKLPYREGDWFAVPLRTSGYGVGIVARAPKRGKVLFGYFFGPRRDKVPRLEELSSLRATDAVLAVRFGDLALIKEEWPIIGGCAPSWNRAQWPMLSFVREEELSGRAWAVDYADDDPSKIVAERRLDRGGDHLERDSVLGAGAVEIALTEALGL